MVVGSIDLATDKSSEVPTVTVFSRLKNLNVMNVKARVDSRGTVDVQEKILVYREDSIGATCKHSVVVDTKISLEEGEIDVGFEKVTTSTNTEVVLVEDVSDDEGDFIPDKDVDNRQLTEDGGMLEHMGSKDMENSQQIASGIREVISSGGVPRAQEVLQAYIENTEAIFVANQMVNVIRNQNSNYLALVHDAALPYVKNLVEQKVREELDDRLASIKEAPRSDFIMVGSKCTAKDVTTTCNKEVSINNSFIVLAEEDTVSVMETNENKNEQLNKDLASVVEPVCKIREGALDSSDSVMIGKAKEGNVDSNKQEVVNKGLVLVSKHIQVQQSHSADPKILNEGIKQVQGMLCNKLADDPVVMVSQTLNYNCNEGIGDGVSVNEPVASREVTSTPESIESDNDSADEGEIDLTVVNYQGEVLELIIQKVTKKVNLSYEFLDTLELDVYKLYKILLKSLPKGVKDNEEFLDQLAGKIWIVLLERTPKKKVKEHTPSRFWAYKANDEEEMDFDVPLVLDNEATPKKRGRPPSKQKQLKEPPSGIRSPPQTRNQGRPKKNV